MAGYMELEERYGAVRIYGTGYYGIKIQEERGEWWINDDEGGEEYHGIERPSLADVERYRDALVQGR